MYEKMSGYDEVKSTTSISLSVFIESVLFGYRITVIRLGNNVTISALILIKTYMYGFQSKSPDFSSMCRFRFRWMPDHNLPSNSAVGSVVIIIEKQARIHITDTLNVIVLALFMKSGKRTKKATKVSLLCTTSKEKPKL